VFRLINLEATSPDLYFRDSKRLALFNLGTLTFLAYSFRDSKSFALLILRPTFLAYSFRDSNFFALINLESLTVMDSYFRESKFFALFNLETLTVLFYSFRDSKIFALLI